jgi:hypothetical protein
MTNTKEEIILNVLNEDAGVFAKWSIDDRKHMAGTIARILDAVEKHELELKRKIASDEISAKLKIAEEICTLQDKLKEIPFYKFPERREIKFKILELQSELQYGIIEKIANVHA